MCHLTVLLLMIALHGLGTTEVASSCCMLGFGDDRRWRRRLLLAVKTVVSLHGGKGMMMARRVVALHDS